jgi:hypothetical protein
MIEVTTVTNKIQRRRARKQASGFEFIQPTISRIDQGAYPICDLCGTLVDKHHLKRNSGHRKISCFNNFISTLLARILSECQNEVEHYGLMNMTVQARVEKIVGGLTWKPG